MKILIKNGTVIIDGCRRIENGAVLVDDQKIVGVYKDYQNIDCDRAIDVQNHYIMPGFIETHTHGDLGFDFNNCQMSDIYKISDALLDEGVTCFMASLTCENHEYMLNLLDEYEKCDVHNLLGVHLEGPFLSQEMPGVMKIESLMLPQIDIFDEYLQHCSKIKSMTIAPELDYALELIQHGHNKGIVMNIGHSNASASQVMEAQSYGAKGITHLYNAMSQHLHRNPGVVTGAFLSDLYCELIVDKFHIHEDVIQATYRAIGKNRIVLICDANPCKGLKDGIYEFSGKEIEIIDRKARVKETGRIAGSTLRLNQACRHMREICGCSMEDVVQMVAVNPAQMYGLNKGKIEVGYDGDIVVVNDQFDVLAVVNDGTIQKMRL